MLTLVNRLKKKLYISAALYFRSWANLSLIRWRPRVIAVTGSVGKTTMLNLLEVQLGKKAHYSHNANSAFGVAFDVVGMRSVTGSRLRWLWLVVAIPLRALTFRHHQEFYVVEIDGERPKETQFLASWLKPEVTLWVSLGRSHASYYDHQVAQGLFGTVEDAIAHEFAALPKHTSKLVIADGSNDRIVERLQNITVKVEYVDKKSLKSYSVSPQATTFVMKSTEFRFAYPMPREIYVQLAMLEALCAYLQISPVTDMKSFSIPAGRNSYFKGKKDIHIIDSTYNAHLISMKSVISMVDAMNMPHTWYVISDIIEQGEGEAEEHRRLAQVLASTTAEKYVLVGRRTNVHTFPELQTAKPDGEVVSFVATKDAQEYLQQNLKGGETVLFKGSQYLEGIVETLLAHPEDAAKLPRRGAVYEKRRQSWGL